MNPKERQFSPLHVLAAAALALAMAPAAGQPEQSYRPITAQALYEGIMDGGLADWVEDPAQRTMLSTFMATSYILGVADDARGRQWCPPADLGIQPMVGAVMDHLADLPEARRSEDAAAVVGEALGKAHPCEP